MLPCFEIKDSSKNWEIFEEYISLAECFWLLVLLRWLFLHSEEQPLIFLQTLFATFLNYIPGEQFFLTPCLKKIKMAWCTHLCVEWAIIFVFKRCWKNIWNFFICLFLLLLVAFFALLPQLWLEESAQLPSFLLHSWTCRGPSEHMHVRVSSFEKLLKTIWSFFICLFNANYSSH